MRSTAAVMVLVTFVACSPFAESAADTGRPDAGSATDSGVAPTSRSQKYVAEVQRDTPKAYWRFVDASATTLRNEVGTSHARRDPDGPLTGSTGLFDEPGALAFTGEDGKLVTAEALPYAPSFGSFTFEAWVYVPADPDGTYRHVVQHSVGTGSWGIWVREGELGLEVIRGTENRHIKATPPASGRWHHVVALVRDDVELWVDGNELGPLTVSQEDPAPAASFFLGAKSPADPALAAGWKLAEVAVYDSALERERIRAHFEAGLPE